jgi:hypothetical protein
MRDLDPRALDPPVGGTFDAEYVELALDVAENEIGAGHLRKSPASGRGLEFSDDRRSLFTRCLETIPAQGVGVRDAHIAASVRAGSGVPFIRLGRVCAI